MTKEGFNTLKSKHHLHVRTGITLIKAYTQFKLLNNAHYIVD